MALSVEQLITQVSKEDALATLTGILDSLGYPASSWQVGSIQRTLLEMVAELYSELSLAATDIARAGFNSLATGGWLTLLADSHYDNQRGEGLAAHGTCRLADTENSGPHTIAAGEIVVADQNEGYRYRNTTGGTLAQGLTLDLTFEAEVIGADRNVANGAIAVIIEGPPGVTVSNPAIAGSSPASWITRQGADPESDPSLQARNRTKWATLSYAGPSDAYENWAREADEAVTRVYVDGQNPRGPGTVDVYLAGVDGEVTQPVIDAVAAYIEDGRRPLGADVEVFTAAELGVAVTGTVYHLADFDGAEVQAAVEAAIEAYFDAVTIGGTRVEYQDGKLLLGGLYHAIFSVTGVVNVTFSTPTTDVEMTATQVAVPTITITPEVAAF